MRDNFKGTEYECKGCELCKPHADRDALIGIVAATGWFVASLWIVFKILW